MSKIKISELAKELGVNWKDIAKALADITGEKIKTPTKKIDEETANLVKDILGVVEELPEEEEKKSEKELKEKKYRIYDLYHEWGVSFEEFKEALKKTGYEGEISSFTEINKDLVDKVKGELEEIIKKKKEEEERRRKEEEERKRKEEELKRLLEEQEREKREKEEKEKLLKEKEEKEKVEVKREERKEEVKEERKEEKPVSKERKEVKEVRERKYRREREKDRFEKRKKKDFKERKKEVKKEERKKREDFKKGKFEKIKENQEKFSLQAEIQQAQIQSVKDEEKEREKAQAEALERRKESKEEKAEMEALRKLLGDSGKRKKKKKKKKEEKAKREVETTEEDEVKIAIIPEVLTVKDLADILKLPPNQIIMDLMKKGILATINQNIDPEIALKIAEEHGYLAEIKKEGEDLSIVEELPEEKKEELLAEEKEDEENLVERPPVVTVMGHVDHGKTTLLDTIRKTDVAAREKGGITQHIGAYKIKLENGKEITFLDTPGHEAFTTLRARGSKVADIAVLVVAADDGVKPQTVEAINHAKSANVPIIVAINKIDKPGADPERVKRELAQYNLIPEEWGGDTIMVPVSAKTGKNIEELLENILLVAEILELKANPNKPAIGTVIESKLDPRKGAVATVLIENGTLKRGDYFVAGYTWGKVRAMFDERGKSLNEAGPGTPVEILGFNEVPRAGDKFIVKSSEREARQLAEQRKQKLQEEMLAKRRLHLENLQDAKEINIILKADVQGSLEAIMKSIEEIDKKFENVNINIIHSGIGAITESDVMLAAASNGIVIGFNVRPDAAARRAAEEEEVDIKIYGIIYDLIEDLEKALKGLLEPKKREELLGICEVKKIFRIRGVGTVAGCIVIEGVIRRNSKARLVRDGVVIYDGEITSLKRFKEDVKEVAKGYECGLMLKDFNDIKPGDQIESYELVEEKEES